MKIHFGHPTAIRTIVDAVTLYGSKEFESSTRSTIPMLALLKDAPGLFNRIVSTLGFPPDYDLFLEYTVSPVPPGRGKASHTDVMLKAGSDALAIEGKWTESMYETVSKWLKKAGEDQSNRAAVLKGWLSLLQKRVKKQLQITDVNDVVYQMLHRAASAAASGRSPSVAYFLFEPSPDKRAATPNQILDQLTSIWDKLGKPVAFPFYLVTIEAIQLAAFEPLRSLPKGKESTAEAVVAALQDSQPLFSFTNFTCRKVGDQL